MIVHCYRFADVSAFKNIEIPLMKYGIHKKAIQRLDKW